MYSIYWIHYPQHIDPFCMGYIGISKDPQKRYQQHSRMYNKASSPIVTNAIKKGNTILTILQSNLTLDQAKNIEESYRPKEAIGWNICKGGCVPPSRLGKKMPIGFGLNRIASEATKKKMSDARKGVKHNEEWSNNISSSNKITYKDINLRNKMKELRSLTYSITIPGCNTIITNNLKQYCLDNNLSYCSMSEAACKNIIRKQGKHKGIVIKVL